MTLIGHLKNEIRRTGYPLEIQISSILDKQWHSVMNTDSYFDREEQKLRDIDINAINFLETLKMAPVLLRTSLAIECKKIENLAWVFFTRPYRFEIEDLAGQYIDNAQILTKNTENYQIMELILEKTSLHYKQTKRIAISYAEFSIEKKKKNDYKKKREIFEAQNQVKKYVECSFDQLIRASRRIQGYPIEVFFPCIVLDGSMYEAIVENDDLDLKEAKHIVLFTTYRSPYAVYDRCLLIDVVHKDYFTDYLKIIHKDEASLRTIVSKNSSKITRKINDMIEMLGSSKTTE